MRPPELPSRAEVEALVREQYEEKNVAKACANCVNWIRENTFCPKLNKTVPAFMSCHLHESEISHIVNSSMEHLKKEGTESKKIEYLLSAALSCADMTMKLITDIECRVKKQRERTKDKRDRNLLKRDLNMCEQMEDAYEKIGEKIHEIEQQFNWYVQPHFDSAFRKDGKYDSENGDKFNSDTGEFIVCLLKYIRGCFRNENNTQIVSDCLDSLVNNQYCPLEEKDINHYNVTI